MMALRRRHIVGWLLAAACITAGMTASAQVRMTREEALARYFPGATVERRTAFLTDEQAGTIENLGRARVESKLITYYSAQKGGKSLGAAFLETRTVRTMPATFIVVVDPDSSIRLVELLAFHEPEDYMPPERWLEQFNGKSLEDDLYLKRGIHTIAGSTLSAQSIADAVRRILATYTTVVAGGGR